MKSLNGVSLSGFKCVLFYLVLLDFADARGSYGVDLVLFDLVFSKLDFTIEGLFFALFF